MPGNVDLVEPQWVRGWARHPVHHAYPLTVHALDCGRVVATTLAEVRREDGMPGFAVALPDGTDHARLGVLLGETDELLPLPARPAPRRRLLTVEDLVATQTRRRWVTGACHIDAVGWGLRPETIVDLLCRDFLAHPAGPAIISAALPLSRQFGFDAVRRMLIDSSEYRFRGIYADRAPGTIFSQQLVQAAAAADFVSHDQHRARVVQVSAAALLALEGAEFIAECYRKILRKEPDGAGLAHYLTELAAGASKTDIVRHLAADFESISAGIVVVDFPLAPAPDAGHG